MVEAALEVIAEVGIGRTTHRAVARLAGLPLGTTTYYFPTLDDLIAAALRRATAEVERDVGRWGERLGAAGDVAGALVGLVLAYLSEWRRARVEYELYLAAARDSDLRPLAVAWLVGVREALSPRVGDDAAWAICALLDGVMLQALATGEEPDAARLTAAIRQLSASA